MTTEQDTASEEPTAAEAEERWRPTRRSRIAALVLAVLLVAGITGGVIVMSHNESAPLDAVRAYVDAIARGDASAANAMVDPERLKQDVDPDLLTDKVLSSAKRRITVEDVRLGIDENLSADVVEVEVDYRLGDLGATATLRAERSDSTLGVLHDWRVIDPLLAPVYLETNEPRLETATLGGTTVPVGGPASDGWPERRFFVYPAVYEVHGHDSSYLKSEPAEVVVTGDDFQVRTITTNKKGEPLTRSWVYYEATSELGDEVSTRLDKHLRACVAAAPKVPGNCPWVLDAYASFATGITLDGRPTLESIESYQVEYRPDGKIVPSLRFTAHGQFSYNNEDGERKQQPFPTYGRVVVTPDDDLTVTFTQ